MRRFEFILLTLCAAIVPVTSAHADAEDAEIIVAYRAGRVVTSTGEPLTPGIVVLRGETVEAVLSGKEKGKVPKGAELIDLGDAVIVPGFVNPLSAVSNGSIDSRSLSAVVGASAGNSPSDGRRRDASQSVKASDLIHRRLGRSGYTAYGWLPSLGGLFAGEAVALRPASSLTPDVDALRLRPKVYLLMNFELGKRWYDTTVAALKKAADVVIKERAPKEKPKPKAEEKKGSPPKEGTPTPAGRPAAKPPSGRPANAAAAKPAAPSKPPPPDPLVDVFRGKQRLLVNLRSPALIDYFWRAYDTLELKPKFTLVVPPMPPEIIEKIAARKEHIESVVLAPDFGALWDTSIVVESMQEFLRHKFTVSLVPLGDNVEGFRFMPYRLAQLSKAGVPEEKLLAAVTTEPAKLLGLEGKVGALKAGALASFSVYDRDPLAGTATLKRCVIAGEDVFFDDPAQGELDGVAVR